MIPHTLAETVIAIINPLLLMALALIVVIGWAIRLRCNVSYVPPFGAKMTAIIAYLMLAIFYFAAEYVPWPTVTFRAFSRVVFLLLVLHELMHHAYVLWLWTRLNGKKVERG